MDKNMPKVRGFARAAMVITCQFGPRGVDELFSNDKELGKSLLGTLEQEIFVSGGQKDQLSLAARGVSLRNLLTSSPPPRGSVRTPKSAQSAVNFSKKLPRISANNASTTTRAPYAR